MITRENLEESISLLDESAKQRVLNSPNQYCVLYAHVFNAGAYTTCTMTNNYNRYRKVLDEGHAILPTDEVINIINHLND